MKLTEMKEILGTGGIQLTKSLGQNFLHDGNQLRRIVEAAELAPADKVLEIGPGLGPLTELLAASAGEVLAIARYRNSGGPGFREVCTAARGTFRLALRLGCGLFAG